MFYRIRISCCPLLPVFFFIASCTGQNERVSTLSALADSTTASRPILVAQPSGNLIADYDPYFIGTRDTVSVYGPHSIVRNLLQDKAGDMWFATWHGIIRYDGKSFINFTNKAGLRSFHVFSVLEEESGELWFGTIGAGAYRYDGASFVNFTEQNGLAHDMVTCMLEDKAGNIWLGTDGGVSRYDGRSFHNFPATKGVQQSTINSITEDKAGKIWFGTLDGVGYYDGKSFTDLKNAEGRPFHNVRSVLADKTGNIWIGGADGLFRYDGKMLHKVMPNFIGYLLQDKTGNIWISAGELNGRTMSLYRCTDNCPTKIINAGDLQNNSGVEVFKNKAESIQQIFGIFEDKAGNIWFGTDHGVYRYDGKTFTGFTK